MNNSKIRDEINKLCNSVYGIEDSAVIISDGLVVSANIVHDIDEEKLGTISASLFGLANTAAKQFEKDEAQYVIIKCKKSYIALFRISEDAVLLVDFKANEILDKIINECLKSSEIIKNFV